MVMEYAITVGSQYVMNARRETKAIVGNEPVAFHIVWNVAVRCTHRALDQPIVNHAAHLPFASRFLPSRAFSLRHARHQLSLTLNISAALNDSHALHRRICAAVFLSGFHG